MDKFKDVRDIAVQVFMAFGSTYICEQTFSNINLNKKMQQSYISMITWKTFLIHRLQMWLLNTRNMLQAAKCI
jgi:hypothetical protein